MHPSTTSQTWTRRHWTLDGFEGVNRSSVEMETIVQSINTSGLSIKSLSIVLATATSLLLVMKWLFFKNSKLPPGPRGLPIVGSIMLLEPRVHRSFTRLAQRYGPIMHMRLGVWDTVVISGVREAELLFKSRDLEFASRPCKTVLRLASKYMFFDGQDIIFQKSQSRLKFLRRICLTEVLAPTVLNKFAQLRIEEMYRLIKVFAAVSDKGETVQLRESFLHMTSNVMTELLAGKRLYGTDLPEDPDLELQTFRGVVYDMNKVGGSMNIADLIPALEWLDPAGMFPLLKSLQCRMTHLWGRILEDHKQASAAKDSKHTEDLCDILLNYEGDSKEKLSESEVKGVLMDLLGAGTETTSATMEWLFAELLHHPLLLQRLQEEVDRVVGSSRAAAESDLRNMPLLDAVLKETFRLHPPAPLLLPHLNEEATTLAGYNIPKNTTLFVNTWAMGRDPCVWDNPLDFNPDRFLGTNSKVTTNGSSYELLPFGTGRRFCVGYNLANLMVKFTIASMVHAFNWSPSPSQKSEDISFEERIGVSTCLDVPIVAVPKARPNAKYYHL